jgi:uncharacterized membrane protein YbhN (UPF0104 family)
VVLAQVFINNLRWLLLLRGLSFQAGIRQTLPLTFISLFFSFMMPGGVGGDVIKGYYLVRANPNLRVRAVVSILMDRILGFFGMTALAVLALPWAWPGMASNPKLHAVAAGVVFLFVGFLFFLAVSFSRRARRLLPQWRPVLKLYDAFHAYRTAPWSVVGALGLSWLGLSFVIGFFVYVALRLGDEAVPVASILFLAPIGLVVQVIPISPAGIGVGQAALFFLFSSYLGHESQFGPAAVTMIQVFSFAWGLLGAFFYLRMKPDSAALSSRTPKNGVMHAPQ